MAAELITLPFRPVINTRGVLEPGALLDVFQSGTTTRVSVFADADLSAPLTNPVVADAAGVFPTVYFDNSAAVRVRVRQANGSVLGDADPYFSDGLASTDIAFIQSGTGASSRTVQAKLRDTVSVKDFGAVGDGVTNDTGAIQAAIDAVEAAGGGTVFFPRGSYRIISALTIDTTGVCLVGASRWSAEIVQATTNARILNIAGMFGGVRSLGFRYSGTPVSGATAIYVTKGYVTLHDFVVRSSWDAVHWIGADAVAGKISDFEILDYESAGIIVQETNDVFVRSFIINAGNTTRGALGGIRLVNKVEAFICSDGDILLGQYSMTMVATPYDRNTRPAYNNFTNVFFDSGALSTEIANCVETEFVGCWFSGGRSGAGFSGAAVFNCQSIRFVSCRFFNNGANGVTVNANASDITFIGCKADSNSVTTGAGVSHGFSFADNTTQFQVIGCTSSNGLFFGTQGYGIFVGSGCDQFRVRDCNLLGNATGPLLDGAADTADKTIDGNIGYRTTNRGQTTVTSGATSVVVSHGLNVTPAATDIQLTLGGTAAGAVDLYADTFTSTQFTIRVAPAPSSNLPVNWQVRSKGA